MFALGGRSTTALCVLFLALVSLQTVSAGSGSQESSKASGSTESGQARSRKHKSHFLTEKKDHNGDNMIVAALVNCSLELSGEEAVEWNLLIEECNATSHNASLTSDEILVFCASKIKVLFGKFASLREKFLYHEIGGWGDFSGLFQVSIWINADFTESLLLVTNGRCEIERAILEFENSCADQAEKDALAELRAEIAFCVGDASLGYEEKMANLSTTFAAFFKMHAAWKEEILSIEVVGFGSIGSFLDVSDMFFRIAHFHELFVISAGETDCDLVVELSAEMNNAKYNFSRAEKTQLSDFVNNIRVLIAGNAALTVEMKIKAVVYQYSQLMKISSFLKFRLREFAIGVSFGFGTFGDLIAASDFGSRVPPTAGPSTIAPATTPGPAAPATTPGPAGTCAQAADVVAVKDANSSIFFESSAAYCDAHPGNNARNWRPYLQMCQNSIIMDGGVSASEKIKKIAFNIRQWIGTNPSRKNFLFDIKIGSWGTYEQFCACGSN